MSVKKSDNRKNEILEVAENLFVEKGFEDTSVNSIIKVVNIA